jgi:hypothetical protein
MRIPLRLRLRAPATAMLFLMASGWPSAKANAGFVSTVEIHLGTTDVFPGINEQVSNTINLVPITIEDQVRSGTHLASGFASIEPFPAGEATVIYFRAEAIARMTTGTSAAEAKATWEDHIYASWLPDEPRAEFIWGSVLHLNGTLSARITGFGLQAILPRQVRFTLRWLGTTWNSSEGLRSK